MTPAEGDHVYEPNDAGVAGAYISVILEFVRVMVSAEFECCDEGCYLPQYSHVSGPARFVERIMRATDNA